MLLARPGNLKLLLPGWGAGQVKGEERQQLWQQEHTRIVFATPQTFWNDVKKGEAGGAVKCQGKFACG